MVDFANDLGGTEHAACKFFCDGSLGLGLDASNQSFGDGNIFFNGGNGSAEFAGNVGIGKTSSGNKLEIEGQGDTKVVIDARTDASNGSLATLELWSKNGSGTNNFGQIEYDGNGSFIIGSAGSGGGSVPITFRHGNTERARIDTSGRLLVGTTSASTLRTNIIPKIQTEATAATENGISLFTNVNASTGPFLIFGKSRGTTAGSNTVVQNNDALATLLFIGADGTDRASMGASIGAAVDGTPGANDMPGRLVFSTTADGSSSPTERMRIDSSGNVGIGTAAPSPNVGNGATLHIRGASTTSELRLTRGNGTDASITAGSSSGGLGILSSEHIGFYTNGSNERLRIDSSGRLLVGTTTVVNSTDVASFKQAGNSTIGVQTSTNTDNTGAYLFAKSSDSSQVAQIGVLRKNNNNMCGFIRLDEEDGLHQFFWADNSGKFRISSNSSHVGTTNGTIVGTQTSDERLKNVGANVAYGLAEIKQLQPKQYNLIADPTVNKIGFIAQEVESIIPEAVFDTQEELDGHQEGDRTKLGMEYVQLIPVLVNAIKELSTEVDTLKTKVAALEAD